MKFNDENGNGVKDPGENGIADWTILLREDDLLMLTMTTTDANGVYSFDQLHAGKYMVGEFLTAGWTRTTLAREIILTDGQIVNGVDIGNHACGFSVVPLPGYANPPIDLDGDCIYEDLNINGRLDFADVVLYFNQMSWIAANEPIPAFDLNGNGRIDFADIVALFNEI